MKTTHKIISILMTLGFVFLIVCGNSLAQESEEKVNFEDESMPAHHSHEMTDKLIEREMKRLKHTDPDAFKRLTELREKNPEEFKQELREYVHLQFERRPLKRHPGVKGPHRGEGGPRPSTRPMDRGRGGGGLEMLRNRLDEFTQWLKENYPTQAEDLNKLKETAPELYRRRVALNFHKYREIFEASRKNPEFAKILKEDLELKSQRDKLLKEISQTANKEEKEELLKELEVIVGKRFDIIVKKKQIEYEQLSKRLKKLEEEVKQSQARVEKWNSAEFKNKNVKSRIKELIQETKKFRWD
ncbi:MAG: hypothetical protein ACYSSI_05735 [Planctomycetota bacterium]|jgi:hypothetical protein